MWGAGKDDLEVGTQEGGPPGGVQFGWYRGLPPWNKSSRPASRGEAHIPQSRGTEGTRRGKKEMYGEKFFLRLKKRTLERD